MIVLKMNRPDYENDIRALLMAFFYGEKIVYEAWDYDHILKVTYGSAHMYAEITGLDGITESGETPVTFDDYKQGRNQVKNLIYDLLSSYTGMSLPWGTLTGIRPTKIPMEMYERGLSTVDAREYLMENYKVSEEKAVLCVKVAKREQFILQKVDDDHSFSLYVGIPFCPSICAYCSFSSSPLNVWKDYVDQYLDALEKEIKSTCHMFDGRKLTSFYMGGGTPTSLTAEQMDRLLTCLEQHFDLAHAMERTVEAGRPDSITPEKLAVIYAHGIDRISINPQTMHQETLDLIGRKHTVEQVEAAFAMAREAGFKNINMDLIAGLPGERAEHMQATMDKITALNPDSITVHSLALKRAAFLNQNREQFPVADAAEVNEMIAISRKGAATIGAFPYYMYRQKNIAGNLENVGYAKAGCDGLYNILIMEETQSILALGAGASTKFVMPYCRLSPRIERVENVKSVRDYVMRIDEMIQRKLDFKANNPAFFA